MSRAVGYLRRAASVHYCRVVAHRSFACAAAQGVRLPIWWVWQRTAQATKGTVRLSRIATEVSEVQIELYAAVLSFTLRWRPALVESKRQQHSVSGLAKVQLCSAWKALASTHYRGTITPHVRLAHRQELQQRFTQEQHAIDAPYEN